MKTLTHYFEVVILIGIFLLMICLFTWLAIHHTAFAVGVLVGCVWVLTLGTAVALVWKQ